MSILPRGPGRVKPECMQRAQNPDGADAEKSAHGNGQAHANGKADDPERGCEVTAGANMSGESGTSRPPPQETARRCSLDDFLDVVDREVQTPERLLQEPSPMMRNKGVSGKPAPNSKPDNLLTSEPSANGMTPVQYQRRERGER